MEDVNHMPCGEPPH